MMQFEYVQYSDVLTFFPIHLLCPHFIANIIITCKMNSKLIVGLLLFFFCCFFWRGGKNPNNLCEKRSVAPALVPSLSTCGNDGAMVASVLS